MHIKILGAYGSKSKGYGSSAFYLNTENVIDAGNLLESLDISSIDIENIWITHSHLDHIIDIAYILDNYFNIRKKSLNIIGLPQTIKAIRENFLNDIIWPDFSQIPLLLSDEMAVTYQEIEIDKKYEIGANEYIKAFLTDHTVASCGYIYYKNSSAVLITSDTYSLDTMKEELQKEKQIKTIVIECSFPNELKNLAIQSKHLTPELLFEQLKSLKKEDLSLCINHIKPFYLKKISDQISQIEGNWKAKILKDSEFINF